jgi:hypothetical protein
MYSLRATRASPPGQAGSSTARRETYSSALHQFDELMAAAAEVSAVSRPMLLYYAMHQAGKAVCAAWTLGSDWNVRGHGLKQASRDAKWRKDVRKFLVKPDDSPGVFGAFAAAIGSHALTAGVEVGELWAAIPESGLPYSARLPALPVHLSIAPDFGEPGRMYSAIGGEVDFGDIPSLTDAAAVSTWLSQYPGAARMKVSTHNGELLPWPAASGNRYQVLCEPDPAATEDDGRPETIASYVAKRFAGYPGLLGAAWLIPPVGENADLLPPVLLWWVLMHALSLLARYEPGTWRDALNLDRSQLADPLQQLLDEALRVIPGLMYEAATSGP